MATGTGAKLLSNLPAQPYLIDPGLFFQLTGKAIKTTKIVAFPGPGLPVDIELPHVGILSKITISFEGTVAGASAGVEDPLWAYRLLREIRFSGSGQTDLIDFRGIDAHVLRFIQNPALARGTEFYTTTPDENGNFRVVWHVPIATDMTSLVGSIWAQSQANQLTLQLRTATLAELGITGGAAAITGNFKITEIWFDPPYHPDGSGRIVIPDMSRIHGIVTKDQTFTNTGDVPVPLIRQQAQLQRLLCYVDLGSATGVANPVNYAAVAPAVDLLNFTFGAVNTPFEWDPAWLLAAQNSEHYGAMLPTGYVCMDQVRENAVRDAMFMPGMTDPTFTPHIKTGTALGNNAFVHLLEELLYVSA